MDDIEKFFDSYENIKSPQSWDNVGTLIDCKNGTTKYMLTIDVTEAVINECIEKNILNIVSYHPFIFSGLKTIPEKYIKVIQNNISVHSVHTRLDYAMCLNIAEILNAEIVSSFDTFIIAQSDVNNLSYYLSKCKSYIAEPGMRYVLSNVHSYESIFDTVIIGVGSAQKEFIKHAKNALIITGEMSHHDMLYYRDNGCSVILMEHSNIERIYLQVLYDKMLNAGFDVTVSRFDADPVKIFLEK